MRWLADMPLRRKLALVILSICGIVLILAFIALATYEIMNSRAALVHDSTTLAGILGNTTQASLAFDDADAARSILKALQAEPQVIAARLFDLHGNVFVDYVATGEKAAFPDHPGPDGYQFIGNHLALFQPVILDGKLVGTIYLQVGLQGMYHRLGVFAVASVAVLVAAFLIAIALSSWFQRIISSPILGLARTAQIIAERRDYTVRTPVHGHDEIGVLTEAFNRMLERIHQQNQALMESEERVRAVLNSALSAVVVFTAEGEIADWNPRAESMFGRTRAEVLGKSLPDLIIPDNFRDTLRHGLAHYHDAGARTIVDRLVETNVLRQDGSEFPIELSVSPMKTGGVVSFCGFITDITERKQAEVKVHAQIARLDLLNRITRAIGDRLDLPSIFQVVIRNLEDNLPIDFGIACMYDGGENTLTVTSVGMLGEALATELGIPLKARLPIDQNGLSRAIAGDLTYEPDITKVPFPFPQRLARGGLNALVVSPLVVESKVFGVLIAARRKSHSFSSAECEFLRQLSDQVALAAHQSQLYEALQDAYNDLRQSQQTVMQQERLRALGQMASGIAHDINNAISPVALYTESLLEVEPGLSQRARNYLETIKRAIEDVAHTVARMREFYRQRENQLELASVDANQMVQQVLDLTRARWSDMPQQRGIVITVVTELTSTPAVILGIASEVREALINLVFNAVDALPEGGTITLRTLVVHGGHPVAGQQSPAKVHIEISDTGIGMDEETRRRCLEPFFTTKGERGTGLGLAMVYGVLQRHNAEIEIESVVQRGTTMRLCFPSQTAMAAGEAAPVGATPTRLRLLVVDDDPILLKSLRDILETDGHAVTIANHGQAGIDAFRDALARNEPFAIVITDLGMPYVDGRKVASTVKEASPTTPVIMLTGWGQRLVAEGEVPPHVDRILNKPPKLGDLRQALNSCCELARGGHGN